MDKLRSIYIIEDDESIRSIVSMVLAADGYNVRSASNGLEALELISKEGVPDLILLDMKMPLMDGWRFASEFVAHYGHTVPIIVMTAAEDAMRRAADIDADALLVKPFDLLRLQSTVKKYIGHAFKIAG